MSKQLLLIFSISVTVYTLALPSLKLPVDQNNIDAHASNRAGNLTNVTRFGNVTDANLTTSDNTTSSAGLFLEEVIKALQTGDNDEAKNYF
jgi:hypothetical protein